MYLNKKVSRVLQNCSCEIQILCYTSAKYFTLVNLYVLSLNRIGHSLIAFMYYVQFCYEESL